jgi:hypothetical protein
MRRRINPENRQNRRKFNTISIFVTDSIALWAYPAAGLPLLPIEGEGLSPEGLFAPSPY